MKEVESRDLFGASSVVLPTGPKIHENYGLFESDVSLSPDLDVYGLFVVGCARSGTTLLQQCLNVAPDIYLLGEANLALNFAVEDFSRVYNEQHRAFGNARSKDTLALDVGPLGDRPGRFLVAQAGRFKYVGEKIAFGPHSNYFGWTHQENFFQFHMRFFYRSRYFFIFRRPDEVIASMSVKFPEASLDELVLMWLLTVDVYVDFVRVFPHVWTIELDTFDISKLNTIGHLLGEDLQRAAGFIDPAAQKVTSGAAAAFWATHGRDRLLAICHDIHDTVTSSIDARSLTLGASSSPSDWADYLHGLVREARQHVAMDTEVLGRTR